MMVPSTAELLLLWDAQRARTLQKELGMSALGGCRRHAGYILAGEEPSKRTGSVRAVLGTAVHDAVGAVLRQMRDEGVIPADSVIEEEVHFGGVLGHPDLYVRPVLRDTKTLGYQAQLDKIKVDGPKRNHRWQIMTYAAALITMGLPVERVQLDYIARDSGLTWMWEGDFDLQDVKDAMAWLQNVRETPLEWLSRDFAPDSETCKGCQFAPVCWEGHVIDRDERSVLFVEDPDAAGWAARLEDARARKHQAEDDEKLAKGVLDALRPNTKAPSRAEVEIPGYPKLLRFTVSNTNRIDNDQVRADYARGGGVAPVTKGTSVKLELVAPKIEDE